MELERDPGTLVGHVRDKPQYVYQKRPTFCKVYGTQSSLPHQILSPAPLCASVSLLEK